MVRLSVHLWILWHFYSLSSFSWELHWNAWPYRINKQINKGKTYRRFYILGSIALNYWVKELFRLCKTPNRQGKTLNTPPPNRPLSGDLSGPDSAALRTTVWFCRRVWLFDYGSYSNRKERSVFSVPESMPVGCTMFYIRWEVQRREETPRGEGGSSPIKH